MQFTIAILPGDGIGPEVINEACKVLTAVAETYGHDFTMQFAHFGGDAMDLMGDPFPEKTRRACEAADAILLGAVGGPKWDDPNAKVRPEDGLLGLRRLFLFYANVRPVTIQPSLIDASPLKPNLLKGVDLVVVRELTGGLYFSKPSKRWETAYGRRRAVDTLKYTEEEIRRILKVGFDMAGDRRGLLTSVDKANVLETSRLWRQVAGEMAQEFPDVTLEHMLVDNAAMQLVVNPARFDVIVTENTFGDILTDEAAAITGSLGMLPSASLGPERPARDLGSKVRGVFEPIHGSAPDIAGRGMANPVAAILSVAMMLRLSLGLEREAQAVERAVGEALEAGYRTADISRPGALASDTTAVGDAVAARIRQGAG